MTLCGLKLICDHVWKNLHIALNFTHCLSDWAKPECLFKHVAALNAQAWTTVAASLQIIYILNIIIDKGS